MFTGIIEETGNVQSITKNKITVHAESILEGVLLGDSISVNGICLTVTKINSNSLEFDISVETKNVTSIGNLKVNSLVNLERAVQVGGRLGGGIVTGHVDSVGTIKNVKKDEEFYILEICLPHETSKYVAKKGSITIDGINLTVADIKNDIISIAIIPHTYKNTNLKTLKVGNIVNVETDILAKYVEKFLSTGDNKSGISMEFLMENGF